MCIRLAEKLFIVDSLVINSYEQCLYTNKVKICNGYAHVMNRYLPFLIDASPAV